MDKKQQSQWAKLSKFSKGLVIGTAVVAAYCLALVTPYISPYAWFPVYLVKCGQMPIVASNFAAGSSYEISSDGGYKITPFTNRYFCSEGEAKRAGFSNI